MAISWYDIKPEDVGHGAITYRGRRHDIHSLMGRVQTLDIGKRIYIRDIGLRTQLQVENDEQRDARRAEYPNW